MVYSMLGLERKRNELRTESLPAGCCDVWTDHPEEQKESIQTTMERSKLLEG